MNLQVDEITRRKLILIRQLFYQAKARASAQHNFVDRMMALIGFDLSVETLLKVIVGILDEKHHRTNNRGKLSDDNLTFKQVVNKVNELLTAKGFESLPPTDKIFHLRYLRNDAQHNAKYPNLDDLSDCETYVRDFHADVIRLVWNESFEDLSLVDLVKHEEIREFLVRASNEIKEGKFSESVGNCAVAFETVKLSVKAPLLGAGITSYGARDQLTLQTFAHLAREIETVRNYVLFILVGIDIKEHRRFRKILDGIKISKFTDGSCKVSSFDRKPCDSSEAEFVFNYVSNAVLKYESYAHDIVDLANAESFE